MTRHSSTSSIGGGAAEKSVTLATSLRDMTCEEAEIMIGDIYASLSEFFRTVIYPTEIVINITANSTSSISPIDLSDLLQSVVILPKPYGQDIECKA